MRDVLVKLVVIFFVVLGLGVVIAPSMSQAEEADGHQLLSLGGAKGTRSALNVHVGHFDEIEPCLITLDPGWAEFDNLVSYTFTDEDMVLDGNNIKSLKTIVLGDNDLGSMTLKWDNVGYDADGDRIDIRINASCLFAVPDGIGRLNQLSNQAYVILLGEADGASSSSSGGEVGNSLRVSGSIFDSSDNFVTIGEHASGKRTETGIKLDMRVEFLKHGTEEPASGSYLFYADDLDNGWWDTTYYPEPTYGAYVESMELGEGFSDVYEYTGTVLYQDGRRFVSKSTNLSEESTDNDFLAPADSTFSFTAYNYRGMNSFIFKSEVLPYAQVRKDFLGDELEDGQFDFMFYNAAGEPVQYATNTAEGDIRFMLPNYGSNGVVYVMDGGTFDDPVYHKATAADLNQQVIIGWVREMPGDDLGIWYDTEGIPVYATLTSLDTVNEGGPFYRDVSIDPNDGGVITNRTRPKVVITKVDAETGESLAGAKFRFVCQEGDVPDGSIAIFDDQGQYTGYESRDDSQPDQGVFETGADGAIALYSVPGGRWLLEEVQAPNWYKKESEPTLIKVPLLMPSTYGVYGRTVEYEVENEKAVIEMPMTGSSESVLNLIAAFLALSVGIALEWRRRQSNSERQ